MRKLYFLSFKLLLVLVVGLHPKDSQSQCAILDETFSSSLGQFTASNGVGGNWQFTSSCTYSSATGHSIPGSALFSGSGCQFGSSGTVSGNLTSPSVSIPPTGAELTFNYYLYNECGNSGSSCYYDRLSFQISDNNGSSYTTIMDSYTDYGNGILYNGGWNAVTFDLSAYAGEDILIRFNFNSIDGAVNAYDGVYVDDVVVTAICPFDNDAGIAGIINPSLPTCDLDSLDITVALQSFGLDTLYSCLIKWQVDNGPVTTFNYSGIVPALGGLDTVTIGNVSLSNLDELTVWTEMPNGVLDSLPQNDEDSIIVAMGLSGTYSIPGDYATINAAADDLNTYGVCDDVVFNLAAGTYTEQVTFGNVLGVNENATVTFQSVTGDADDVTIEFASNSQADNWVINLNGSDWFTFQDLTVQNTGTYIYTNVFDLLNGADHNTIQDCHIIGGTYGYTGTGNYMTGVYLYGVNSDNKILNNHIENGSCAIYSYGSSADHADGLLIQGNEIEDAYYQSVYIYYTDRMSLIENRITANSSLYTSPYGVYMWYSNKFNIKGNYIGTNFNNGFSYPLYMYYCNGESNPRSEISNNCLHAGTETSTSYGYYGAIIQYSGIFDMNNNTIIRRGSANNYALSISNGGLVRLKNNNIANLNGGYALYAPGAFTLTESDHNNFYTNSGTPIYWGTSTYSTLELFTEASGFDANSVATDPQFENEIKCITCNGELDGNGTPIATVSTDIEGNTRSLSVPDIGAIEYVNGDNFNLGPDTTLCATSHLVEAGPAQLVVWNVNGNFAAGPNYELTTSGVPQADTVIAEVTTLYCGSGIDTVIITLIPNAALDSAMHLCADEAATLAPGGGANATYQWNNGETTSSIEVSEPGFYSVVKMEEGCESQTGIEVTQSTAVDIFDLEPCEDDSPLSVDATIPDGSSYAWSGGTSMTTPVNTFDNSGSYAVTATDLHACTSVDSFTIQFLGEPDPAITYVGTGGTAILFSSANSQNVGANTSYLWTFNGSDTSSSPNPLYIFPWSATAVTYPVLLEVDNGCGVDQVQINISIDPLGVEELEGNRSFTVFPNPAQDVVYLKSSQEWKSLEVSITDNAGRLIRMVNYNAASELIELNTSELSGGSYLLKVSSDTSSEVHTLIIQ